MEDDCIESDIVFKWTYCCRLCLSNTASIDLFTDGKQNDEVVDKITSYLNLLVYVGDPMPRKVCLACLAKIDSWKEFQEKCIETESNVKKRLKPFQSLPFVKIYLERSSDSTQDTTFTPTPKNPPFVSMGVKEEPVDDAPKIAEDSSFPTEPNTGQIVSEFNGDKEWNENENSADTVFDEPLESEETSGLDILRQMANGTPDPAHEPSRTVPEPLENHKTCEDPKGATHDNVTNGHDPESTDLPPEAMDVSQDTQCDLTSTNFNTTVDENSSPDNLTELPIATSHTSVEGMGGGAGTSPFKSVSKDRVDPILDIKIKVEPGLPEAGSDPKYNLRKRGDLPTNYNETDWPEDTSTPPLRPQPAVVKPFRQKVTPWKCEPCQVYFSKSSNLKAHQIRKDCLGFKMNTFPCLICGKIYYSENCLAEHNLCHMRIAFNLSVDDLRACKMCDLAFADLWRYQQHRSCHAAKGIPSQAPKYTCKECGLVFIKRSLFEEHKKSHLQGLNDLLREDVHSTDSEPTMPLLATMEVIEEKDYSCSLCIARFKGEDLLYDHRFAIHGISDERVSCSVCSAKFREAVLPEHMKIHERRAVARKTTTPFFKISNLRTLQPPSLAAGSVRCRRCGMVFNSHEELNRHEAEKHKNPNPYHCRKCNRRFPTRSNLLFHQREHNTAVIPHLVPEGAPPSAPPPNVTNFIKGRICYFCKVEFKSDFDLKNHREAHVRCGQKTALKFHIGVSYAFQCSSCPQMFSQNKTFDRHIKTKHDGVEVELIHMETPVIRSSKPFPIFKCKLCKIKLLSQASLNFHMKVKHLRPKAPAESAQDNISEVKVPGTQECPSCLQVFGSAEIEEHSTKCHPLQNNKLNKLHQCRYCAKICTNAYNLGKHEQTHSNLECPFCKKWFAPKLYRKYQSHVENCSKLSKTSTAVTPPTPPQSAPPVEHVANNGRATRATKCMVCGKNYDTPSLLELHIMTAHGMMSAKSTKPTPGLELWQEETNKIMREVNGVMRCTLCQMHFDSPESAAWHRSQHPRGNLYVLQIDDSLFQCTICDQLFSDRRNALKHAAEHGEVDIKPQVEALAAPLFNCPFCVSKFATEDSIRSHIFYVHPGGSSNTL